MSTEISGFEQDYVLSDDDDGIPGKLQVSVDPPVCPLKIRYQQGMNHTGPLVKNQLRIPEPAVEAAFGNIGNFLVPDFTEPHKSLSFASYYFYYNLRKEEEDYE